MGVSFFGGCGSSADDTHSIVPLGEADNEQAASRVVADDKLSLLGVRMVWIGEDAGKWIRKYCDGIGEGDTVLAKIDRSFAPIPYELHTLSLASSVSNA